MACCSLTIQLCLKLDDRNFVGRVGGTFGIGRGSDNQASTVLIAVGHPRTCLWRVGEYLRGLLNELTQLTANLCSGDEISTS